MPLEVFITPLTTILAIAFGIFLPGAIFAFLIAHKARLTLLEFILLSFGFGFTFVNASMILLGTLGAPLSVPALSLWYGLFFLFSLGFIYFRKLLFWPNFEPLFTSKRLWQLASITILLIFFVKGFYLSGSILPTTTDLGHHLYWAKNTAETGLLPVYEKQEILRSADNHYSLSAPQPIADFIIGEHLSLALIAIFTGASFIGIFPFLFLFLLNVLAVLGLVALALRLGQNIVRSLEWQRVTPEHFAVAGLFLFGVLFSLASPEMKFVSGGVIGNLFGNFFLPIILLCFLRALEEKDALLLTSALVLITCLAYTHHLSTFIFLYVFLGLGMVILCFWHKEALKKINDWLSLLITRPVLIFFICLIAFASLVALPTYLETGAVTTAVGTPTKDTRTGLSLYQLSASNSALKVGASFFALLLILWLKPLRRSLSGALLFAWGFVLLLMALAPQFLLVNIPSNRIANYTSFPLSLLTLLALMFFAELLARQRAKTNFSLPGITHIMIILFLTLTLLSPGFEDNSNTLSTPPEGRFVKQTFDAAEYLATTTSPESLIVKDHNFIEAGDTWMKLFFNRGYSYPFSRSFFQRYEDNPAREHCTLAVISTPNTPLGEQCYQELGVRFIVVNPFFDRAQFQKSKYFSLVYHSPHIAIFEYTK